MVSSGFQNFQQSFISIETKKGFSLSICIYIILLSQLQWYYNLTSSQITVIYVEIYHDKRNNQPPQWRNVGLMLVQHRLWVIVQGCDNVVVDIFTNVAWQHYAKVTIQWYYWETLPYETMGDVTTWNNISGEKSFEYIMS